MRHPLGPCSPPGLLPNKCACEVVAVILQMIHELRNVKCRRRVSTTLIEQCCPRFRPARSVAFPLLSVKYRGLVEFTRRGPLNCGNNQLGNAAPQTKAAASPMTVTLARHRTSLRAQNILNGERGTIEPPQIPPSVIMRHRSIHSRQDDWWKRTCSKSEHNTSVQTRCLWWRKLTFFR